MMKKEFLLPDEELSAKIFDMLPKDKEGSWEKSLATVAYLLAEIFDAGSKEKGTSIELLVAFPEHKLKDRREKFYRVFIGEQKTLEGEE